MNKQGFIYGAIILAIVNFIVRVIGFSYRIILSKLIGPEGIGLFQMVFPVLMMFITITTAGTPIAVSKLVAKQKSLGNDYGVKKILRVTIIITLVISLLLSLIVLVFHEYISNEVLKNKDIMASVIVLSPAIIIISVSSVIRGYFYGLKKISPAGISQIIEQLARISFVLGLIIYLKPLSPKQGAFIAVCGISIGEAFGFLWLILHYFVLSRKTDIKKHRNNLGWLPILSQLSYIAIPITISRIVNVILQMANAILIPQRLMVAGYSNSEAVSIFGRVTGMTMPIVFLPFIVTSALVINIIPNLSEEVALNKFDNIKANIGLALRITFLISIPLAALFIFFGKDIGMFFYGDKMVGSFISIMGYSTIFLSLQHTLSGVLHGLGKQIPATINYIAGMSFQLFATFYLVSKPTFGIYGFFIGFIVSTFIICLLNYFTLNRYIKVHIAPINYIFKPILAASVSIITALLIHKYLVAISAKNYVTFISCLFVGALGYLLTIFIIKGLPPSLVKRLIKR